MGGVNFLINMASIEEYSGTRRKDIFRIIVIHLSQPHAVFSITHFDRVSICQEVEQQPLVLYIESNFLRALPHHHLSHLSLDKVK